MVKLNKPRSTSGRWDVPVDSCIADVIQFLNDEGVITYGCCCGHGEYESHCLVDIKSKDILNKLGYELREFSEGHSRQGIYEISLEGM